MFLLVCPEAIAFGAGLFFAGIYSFFPSCNLQAPWADRRKILNDARKCNWFYNTGPKFQGGLPKKNLGAKNMQNLAQFRTSSKFGGKYLWNEWRFQNQWVTWSTPIPPEFGNKRLVNFGPLIAEISMLNHTYQIDLFGRTSFGPLRGAAPPNFYMR